MFHNIRPSVLNRMHNLEQIDARDREDGTLAPAALTPDPTRNR